MRNQILLRSLVIFISVFLLFSISRAQSPVINLPPATEKKLDSNFSYNPAASVPRSKLKSTVQPNPFSQSFIINTFLPSTQPLKLQLLDINGNLVRYKSINGVSGENRIEFSDLGNLQAGVYLVRIIRLDSVTELKIVKAKQ